MLLFILRNLIFGEIMTAGSVLAPQIIPLRISSGRARHEIDTNTRVEIKSGMFAMLEYMLKFFAYILYVRLVLTQMFRKERLSIPFLEVKCYFTKIKQLQ